jgi:hypothetical protein
LVLDRYRGQNIFNINSVIADLNVARCNCSVQNIKFEEKRESFK